MNTLRLLSWSKGVQIVVTAITLAFGTVAGVQLAGNAAWGTVPQTIVLATAGLASVPASLLMGRYGRKLGFGLGALLGAVGSLLTIFAVVFSSFWLLCAGSVLLGAYQTTAQYYRFAAAEGLPAQDKARAIASILAAGVIAAIIGPWIGIWVQPLFTPFLLAGPFAACAVLLALSTVGFLFWRNAPAPQGVTSGRPTSAIVADPGFIQAAVLGASCQSVMSYVMTATPLAVVGCGLSVTTAAIVVQWHLVAMYAPSYVLKYTVLGRSPGATVGLGCVALVGCLIVLASGQTMVHFMAGLILLGIGWNFTHVGATTLLVTGLPATDQAKAQGANELLIWATSTISAISSGVVHGTLGWGVVLTTALIPLMVVIVMALYGALSHRLVADAARS